MRILILKPPTFSQDNALLYDKAHDTNWESMKRDTWNGCKQAAAGDCTMEALAEGAPAPTRLIYITIPHAYLIHLC